MQRRDLVAGVDPGVKGAIAFYNIHTRELAHVEDLPFMLKRAGSAAKEIDAYGFATTFDCFARRTLLACIEDVGAMSYVDAAGKRRGQGAAASFAFGKGAGVVIGVVASYSVPMRFVSPSGWKIGMGLSSNKDVSRTRASALFPTQAHLFARKGDDGRAEAALLALFGARGLAAIAKEFT